LTEIWVPYGPVEVSFDIRQENLAEIIEPQPQKLTQEECEKKALESSGADSILILSDSEGAQKTLDAILSKNKGITKILHPKYLGALARRKAQEFIVPTVEPLNLESITETGTVDGTACKLPVQIKENPNLVILTSVHYDPLFGMTSAASDLVNLSLDLKSEAFKRSIEDLPCNIDKSGASLYSMRLLQTCPNVSVVEVVEKKSVGLLSFFTGEPEATHAKIVEFWKSALGVTVPTRHQRILFGSGGQTNDSTLGDAMSRSFFNVATNIALKDSESKLCMLAECSQGLGSEALMRYATGRYMPEANLDSVSYFEGLETLLSFMRVHDDFELSLVSTLPNYYTNRFDFKPISAARDAPFSVLSQGSRAKILVIPDASSTYFKEVG
jgi:hypothetical protein